MVLRKYEMERRIGELNKKIRDNTLEMEIKKETVKKIRISIGETKKEKKIIKLEEEANKVEEELRNLMSNSQKLEMDLVKVKIEHKDKIVYPVCPSCNNRGNIFVFQGVGLEVDHNERLPSEQLPTIGPGVIYCTKCGRIIGTATNSPSK